LTQHRIFALRQPIVLLQVITPTLRLILAQHVTQRVLSATGHQIQPALIAIMGTFTTLVTASAPPPAPADILAVNLIQEAPLLTFATSVQATALPAAHQLVIVYPVFRGIICSHWESPSVYRLVRQITTATR
jgi:hypothetical protein